MEKVEVKFVKSSSPKADELKLTFAVKHPMDVPFLKDGEKLTSKPMKLMMFSHPLIAIPVQLVKEEFERAGDQTFHEFTVHILNLDAGNPEVLALLSALLSRTELDDMISLVSAQQLLPGTEAHAEQCLRAV